MYIPSHIHKLRRKMTNNFLNKLPAYAVAATLTVILPSSAYSQENHIDCEILICMATGFPVASGCGPAYSEVLDRVTPFPIEPPLQIWNCPFDIPKEYGNYQVDLSSPEYSFATTFRVYHMDINNRRKDGKCQRSSTVEVGTYDNTGAFSWEDSSRFDVPEAAGLSTTGCTLNVRAIFVDWQDEAGGYDSQMIHY